MSARQLQNLWKLQRVSCVAQRASFQADAKSYATSRLDRAPGISGSTFRVSNIDLVRQTTMMKFSSTVAIPKEATHNIDVLFRNLETQYQRIGYFYCEQITAFLDQLEAQLENSKQLITDEQANFLLAACGTLMPSQSPAERLLLFQRLWQYLSEHQQLTLQHYRTQLHVLQYNGAPLSDYRKFLLECEKFGASGTTQELYGELLLVACSNGNISQATDVVADMKARLFSLTEQNFYALILGHGRNRDLNNCQTVLESMVAAGISISTDTQTMLIVAYLENGEQAKAEDVLKKYHGQFESKHILKILRTALSVELKEDFITQLVHELPKEFVAGHEVSMALRILCIELLHNGKLQTVVQIISSLPTPTFKENQNSDTFAVFLLNGLFRAEIGSEDVMKICRMLKDSGKNLRAMHIATEIALRRSPHAAVPYLEALAKEELLRPHYFWSLIMYNFRRHGENGIISTLKTMASLNVNVDRETLMQYVVPYLSVTLEKPLQTLKMLQEAGLKTSDFLTPILSHLLLQHNLDEVYEIIELYPTKININLLLGPLTNLSVNVRATKRYQQFAKVLASLRKRSDNSKVDFIGQLLVNMLAQQPRLRNDMVAFHRFINPMKKQDLSLSPAAINTIKMHLQEQVNDEKMVNVFKLLQEMCDRSLALPNQNETSAGSGSSVIKHPREMSLDELECHLIELQSKGLNARGVLRRLLQLCVRDDRLERALEIKAKCEALRVEVSPGMLASILDLHIKLKDLPNAKRSLKRLVQSYPGFQIDEHKIIDYAALLVHEQQFEAGKELLKERASTMKINGGNYVVKNIWNFLTSVAHFAAQTPALPLEQNLTRDTFAFLQQLGYCSPQNAILGPIVREYLLRGDIKAAIGEFAKLAEQYKRTPLQFELFSLLVRLSNQDASEVERYAISAEEAQTFLAELAAIVTKVHGATNMNSALLLAFAESGTNAQLRRLMINPEFRINQDLLLKNCEYLGQEGAVQTLLRLAQGARGMQHVIDEQGVYNMLLSNFVKENNCNAALNLFESLENDDELKISQEFLRNLVNLLKVNNVEIPSNIALRAQII